MFAHRNEFFFPTENDLDRPARLERQESRDRLHSERPFRSESAAQGLDDNSDSRQRQVEQLSHLGTDSMRHLRRSPDGKLVRRILGNGHMGLERNMLRCR